MGHMSTADRFLSSVALSLLLSDKIYSSHPFASSISILSLSYTVVYRMRAGLKYTLYAFTVVSDRALSAVNNTSLLHTEQSSCRMICALHSRQASINTV